MYRTIAKFSLVAALALPSVLLAQPASATTASTTGAVGVAVTCSGTGCDNRDPVATGCASSAINAVTKSTSKGLFILKYSTVCKTNWMYVGNYAGGSTRSDGKLQLDAWDQTRGKQVQFLASSSAGLHYGNMVYSPGDNCGYGLADWSGGEWDVTLKSSGC
ncbi:hypothetical protein UO65_3939 [Actinokineospora spheciospongiae]|uniref:DUF2690 domain-containing protein n=1 Tax=Actinokineospora spheciospongiae TaxID=909613 RepID=W7IKD4_9PSEU|nr:DUF2690 domain-containing protein [Actinokineospora spheciospongiae]EWC60798.1 hypothetical protein UO65_3939 [Actinokineospora spheciospongiae]PWW63456.1 uncharacterized protein DUF2690 [Actinokineospora spheciospongiae]